MLVANAFLRHLLVDDKAFTYRNPTNSLEEILSLNTIMRDRRKAEIYLNVLA
jgi:hypothetical protein